LITYRIEITQIKNKTKQKQTKTNKMDSILLVLFGCHILELMNDRIMSALIFAKMFSNETKIDWFLSGGIKNSDTISEAVRMSQTISEFNVNGTHNWDFVLDTQSTNTAQNILYVKKHIDESEQYSDVYFVTSDFHKRRANEITKLTMPNYSVKWITSPIKLPDSDYWENIHIRNVPNDVADAIAYTKYK
jgi:hypothetical protein